MSIVRSVSGAVAAVALAIAPAILSASDRADAPKNEPKVVRAAAPSGQFTTLKGVKAVLLTPREMDSVKGQHVHFITLSNGKLHLAGDIKTENNWSNEWGGTDGVPVAPSYHGLCKAHGNGSIFIPTRGAITTQCPPGS